jgi:hypothetical protein
VVCRSCGQWNLTPLEERWEAIEECERLYRDTPRRASTNEIGIATIPDALDLIRIGRPQRPELVAWRYGDRLLRRRRRVQWAGATVGAFGAAGVAGAAMSVAPVGLLMIAMAPILGVYGSMFGWLGPMTAAKRNMRGVLHTAGIDIGLMESLISGSEMTLVRADNADGWAMRVVLPLRQIDIDGSRAYRVLGLLLPKIAIWGASRRDVDTAVGMLDSAVDPAKHIARTVDRICREGYAMSDIGAIPAGLRLSLEMASQEEAERRALEGELAELEAAWRRAEEVAEIADSMLLPASVSAFIERHRAKA